jgi:hypothetical protein
MKRILAALLLLCVSPAFAFVPATGLWWNPDESGRGFTIDYQNGLMVITAYVYTNNKAATWFVAAGEYSNQTDTFTGTMDALTGGQCFGCPYSAPSGSAAGTLTIQFDSTETGTMTFPGGSTNIQHELFGYSSTQDYLLGEWVMSQFVSGSFSTQWVIFNGTANIGGTIYESGSIDSIGNTNALGVFDDASGQFIVVVDDHNANAEYYFQFPIFDDHRMLGAAAIAAIGATPANLPNSASGSRLLYPAELDSNTFFSHPNSADADLHSRLQQMAAEIEAIRGTLPARQHK